MSNGESTKLPETKLIEDQDEKIESTKENQANESQTNENIIETIVESYNKSATNKMELVEKFSVQDKASGHYRTEFRLTAYENAIGKTYKVGEQLVDIIETPKLLGGYDIRLYTDGVTLEQCIEILEIISPILDETVSEAQLSETVDYLKENKEANGYYMGKLGLLLLQNNEKTYDMMIKTD